MTLQLLEHHRFEAAGRPFVYLVPSAGVFALDPVADAVMRLLDNGPLDASAIVAGLAPRFAADQVMSTLGELHGVRVIGTVAAAQAKPAPRVIPLTPFPLTTMVLNVTNQCNLSCTYCYEYGADKIVDTENGTQPKFMTEETARDAVEFMLRESGDSPVAYLTFFGGETLMNFPVLKRTVAYARQRAAEEGKQVQFSLTTNATLLKPETIEFLAENDIGVTISIDGPPDIQDKFRVFQNGRGSYDLVAPRIKELLQRHRSRPIGARVTLASGTVDVKRIYQHLTEELGFAEVGFAPATSNPSREHAIPEGGFTDMLRQFSELAQDFLAAAVEDRPHGFSNVRETLEEIHKGMSKAFPCGAGLGLMGVSTAGDVALCHRFAGSEAHSLGNVRDGINRDAQRAFLDRHHIDDKTDCRTCWARPLCAGGCYHEAHTHYGNTARPNLHYCEWIRGWTDVCLRIYGELAERNPAFLARFDREPMVEKVA
jgi:uncharacterized protein